MLQVACNMPAIVFIFTNLWTCVDRLQVAPLICMASTIRDEAFKNTEDLLLLATTKSESVKHYITTITELVVVWSVYSTCTCTVNKRFLWPQLGLVHKNLMTKNV